MFKSQRASVTRNITSRFVPFGIGKRMCMGDSLAKAELFVFATILLQRFRILPPEEHVVPNAGDVNTGGIIRNPKPFYVRIESAM